MIIVIFFINLVISAFNAWGCGLTWDSSKAQGGMAHFMNWMGAIMSASGFTWCYMVILGFIGSSMPMAWFSDDPEVAGMLLDPATAEAFFQLGYFVIILPIMGSGLAITVHSWRRFARTRSVGDGLVTAWNTYAQVSNMVGFARNAPDMFDNLGDFFSSDGDGDGWKGKIVIGLVVVAVVGGVLTTSTIISVTRKNVRRGEERHRILNMPIV